MRLDDGTVKFTSAGSVTLTVETKQIGTDAVTLAFTVSDTGIGSWPYMGAPLRFRARPATDRRFLLTFDCRCLRLSRD
jgi:hypothetical protein